MSHDDINNYSKKYVNKIFLHLNLVVAWVKSCIKQVATTNLRTFARTLKARWCSINFQANEIRPRNITCYMGWSVFDTEEMTPQTFIAIGILAVIMQAASGHVIGAALNTDFDIYPTPSTPAPAVIYNPRSWYFQPYPYYGGNIDYHYRPVHSSPWYTYGYLSDPRYQQETHRLPVYPNNARCEFHNSLTDKVKNANRSPREDPQSFYLTKRRLPSPLNHDDGSCPNPNPFLQKRQSLSSMPLCPSEDYEIDLGEDFFPRYVYNKVCKCEKCVVDDQTYFCNGLSRVVTVFQRVDCKNGWAVTEPQFFEVQTSCFCGAPGLGI